MHYCRPTIPSQESANPIEFTQAKNINEDNAPSEQNHQRQPIKPIRPPYGTDSQI